MQFDQSKLSKQEWNSTEVPVDQDEQYILKMIMDGYSNVNIKKNKHLSLQNFIQVEKSPTMESYLYKLYFHEIIQKNVKKYNHTFSPKLESKTIKKIDKLRIENLSKNIKEMGSKLFEYYIIHIIEKMCKNIQYQDIEKLNTYYFVLHKCLSFSISNINSIVIKYANYILDLYSSQLNMNTLFSKASSLLGENKYLEEYRDYELYDHQKKLFTLVKRKNPKLILYIAPTGTGKTLSPVALAGEHKVIFVCAARHVGLALARSSITMGKKVAFAFGCNEADDIRLHNNSAASYITIDPPKSYDKKKRKKKPYKKVDHLDGSNVEIMICDLKSYYIAMSYMLSFNEEEKLIMYWDEPTIGMDYTEEEVEKSEHLQTLQNFIHTNWEKNEISNIILSSATLPKEEEIHDVLMDFQCKFSGGKVESIISDDCNKSIVLLNKDNRVVLPHLQYDNFETMKTSIQHCLNYKTILRYLDMDQIIKFIKYVESNVEGIDEQYFIRNTYENLNELNVKKIKMHYLHILNSIDRGQYNQVYSYFHEKTRAMYDSTIFVSTKDAHTITHGPAIFIAEDVDKIGKFIIQNSKIPEKIIESINKDVGFNNNISDRINTLEKNLEDSLGNEVEKEHKMSEMRVTPAQKQMQKQIDELVNILRNIHMPENYVPNKIDHLKTWTDETKLSDQFSSCLTEQDVVSIMGCSVDKIYKILLLMGIGAFLKNVENVQYMELIKKLAGQQKLFMILASSDYIYGTNYQFCHAYISKDMNKMTQEKTIQSMGRVGRSSIGKRYSIRLRDDCLIEKIFQHEENKIEVLNMNKLFVS